MATGEWLAEQFEEHRAHLRMVAYRMLGSASEAEDAVQEAWIRLGRTDVGDVASLRRWLTTVVARVCLDMLRARTSRREDPRDVRLPDPIITRGEWRCAGQRVTGRARRQGRRRSSGGVLEGGSVRSDRPGEWQCRPPGATSRRSTIRGDRLDDRQRKNRRDERPGGPGSTQQARSLGDRTLSGIAPVHRSVLVRAAVCHHVA